MPLVGTAHDRLCEMERPCLRLCPPYKLAQLEAAASLEIAQVAGENISKPRHWRDVETVSQVAEDHCAKAVISGDEIGRGKENGHEIRLGGVRPRNCDGLSFCARNAGHGKHERRGQRPTRRAEFRTAENRPGQKESR